MASVLRENLDPRLPLFSHCSTSPIKSSKAFHLTPRRTSDLNVGPDESTEPPLKRMRKEQLQEYGIGTQGKSRPSSATVLSLLHITDQVKQGLSFDSAVKKTAERGAR